MSSLFNTGAARDGPPPAAVPPVAWATCMVVSSNLLNLALPGRAAIMDDFRAALKRVEEERERLTTRVEELESESAATRRTNEQLEVKLQEMEKQSQRLENERAALQARIEKLAESEQVAQCFVENFLRYALARNLDDQDGCKIAQLTEAVVRADGSDFEALMSGLVKTQAFRYRTAFER